MDVNVDHMLEHLYALDWTDKVRLFREAALYVGRAVVLDYVKEHLGKAAALACMQEYGGGEEILRGAIVTTNISGRQVLFLVNDFLDAIQICHANGAFYEPEELGIIAKHLRPGAVFLDVGANVGNHSLFVAHFLRPSRVISVEPNQKAHTILRHNVNLNGLCNLIDTSFLGIGLSSAEGQASLSTPPENLGGTRLRAGTAGATVPLETGDRLLGETPIDFIKVDTEGMEMDVLGGLKRLIAVNKPAMFVEVDDANLAEFMNFVEVERYVIVDRYRRYSTNENFMILYGS